MGDGRQLRRLLRTLSEDRHVVCVDPLGSGRSAQPPPGDPAYGWAAQVERLLRVLDALVDGPVDLLGASMGGVLAQHLLLRHPERVRSAVLAATGPAPGPRGVLLHELLAAQLRSDLPDRQLLRNVILMLFSPQFLARPGAVAMTEAMLSEQPFSRDAMLAQLGALATHTLDAELSAIDRVRAVFVGELDWLMPAGRAQALAHRVGAPCTVMEDCGHLLWVERHRLFPRLVRQALDAPLAMERAAR
nr:alpha/beta hydrolase [Alphaproteobacteria bacterium]